MPTSSSVSRNSRGQPEIGLVLTAWGWAGVAWTHVGLCGLKLPGDAEAIRAALLVSYPQAKWSRVPEVYSLPLVQYFAGQKVEFTFRLDFLGRGGFFADVWEAARGIPYGGVTTYGELAALAGRPGAARAVGSAMAANPLPIVVPCHRVVASGGKLGGYSGGIEWKMRLLALEGALPLPKALDGWRGH